MSGSCIVRFFVQGKLYSLLMAPDLVLIVLHNETAPVLLPELFDHDQLSLLRITYRSDPQQLVATEAAV